MCVHFFAISLLECIFPPWMHLPSLNASSPPWMPLQTRRASMGRRRRHWSEYFQILGKALFPILDFKSQRLPISNKFVFGKLNLYMFNNQVIGWLQEKNFWDGISRLFSKSLCHLYSMFQNSPESFLKKSILVFLFKSLLLKDRLS